MKRLVALILASFLFCSNAFLLISCSSPEDPGNNSSQNGNNNQNNENNGNNNNNQNNENNNNSNNNPGQPTIVVPEYKDYQRGTIDFKDIVYKRPDIDAVILKFNEVTEAIEKSEISFEGQISKIQSIEEDYVNINTMANFSHIYFLRNSADEFWAGEYEYITTEFPKFAQSIEDMFVAAANSAYAERFENEYFGPGLIEEYKDGGDYTDDIVKLLEDEAALEADYSALSTASVVITYKDITDTYDNILSYYLDTYGQLSVKYLAAKSECDVLYEKKVAEMSTDILIDLIAVRKSLSDAFGHESYLEYAYESIYHDYTYDKIYTYIEDVTEYILPVYLKLANYVFNHYASTEKAEAVDRITLINNAYEMLKGTDSDLYDIYSYMLQHGLFDIEPGAANRYEGAMTTYLDAYMAPFLFVSTTGKSHDYITLFHEFGHFVDYYVNCNSTTSLDLSEVSSQALELLMLTKLEGFVSSEGITYLTYYEMENAMLTLFFQSFYALFEHRIYTENPTTKQELDGIVMDCAEEMGLNPQYYNTVDYVLISHIILYPTYVQSYCTSLTTALEIYFIEKERPGEGFETYKNLLSREDDSLTFEEHLEKAGLTSPFANDALKKIADKIHYEILGSHYFTESDNGDNAA